MSCPCPINAPKYPEEGPTNACQYWRITVHQSMELGHVEGMSLKLSVYSTEK